MPSRDLVGDMPHSMHRTTIGGLLLAPLALLLVARALVLITFPFGVDQGTFAWMGVVVAHGGAPYVDVWDTKGPGVFAVFALLERVWPGPLGARLFDLGLQLLAAAVLVRHPLASGERRSGWLAAAVYLSAYAALGYHETAQPDSWSCALLVIGLAPIATLIGPDGHARRGTGAAGPLFLAAAMVATTATFKPTYAVLGIVPLLVAIQLFRDRPSGAGLRVSLAFLGGLLFPLLVCATWLVSLKALGPMFDVVVRWNSQAYIGPSAGARLTLYRFVLGMVRNVPWNLLPVAAAAVTIGQSRNRRVWLVLVWGLAVLVEITVQQKFWIYHWTPLIGPTAVLVSAGQVEWTFRHGWTRGMQSLRSLALLFCCLFVAGKALWQDWGRVPAALRLTASAKAPRDYDRRLLGIDSVARVVRSRTGPADRVMFFGTLGVGNYLSDRPTMGRIVSSRPLLDGAGSPLRAAYRVEFESQWAKQPPSMFVAYSEAHCRAVQEVQWTCLPAFPELQHRIDREYRSIGVIGAFALFARAQGSGE